MRPYIDIFTITVPLTAAVVGARFLQNTGAYSAAGGYAIGVTRHDGAIGDLCAVQVLGEITVEAGAAIAANALVESDATGRAITRAAGSILGRLAPGQVAATAAGQFVRIIQIQS